MADATTTTTTPKPLPMFGAYNEHWSNHPARLPISQYKPNTNPNTGAAAVDAAWKAAQPATPAVPATGTGTPATPAIPAWRNWYNDWQRTAPVAGQTAATTQTTGATQTTGGTAQQLSKQYTPAMMAQLYDNPWFALGDVFKDIPTTSPLYQQLRDFGGDPLALFNMIKGSQGLQNMDAASYTDWLGQMYKGQGTVGGQGFDAKNLINTLFGQNKFGADATNVIGQLLGAGDMSVQNRTLYNLARDATNVSMNPLAAKGYQASLSQALDKYGDAMLGAGSATAVNPTTWLNQNAPWLSLR